MAPTIPWEAIRAETVSLLQEAIRFNTTNPPGDELPLARRLEEVMRDEGIETQLFEPTPNRAALFGRIRGDGSREPVILLSHMDVVGVEAEQWSCDPFAGVVRDGYLYGRGAIDDKGMLVANLMTMLLLQRYMVRAGISLTRDVVFVATSDEEAGGKWGIQWIAEHHPELIRAEFAINEGGRTRLMKDGRVYIAIQTAEKIAHHVRIMAKGPSGHAAVPLPGNAIFRLGRALARLSAYREPLTLTPTTRRFFGELARVWPNAEEGEAMQQLVGDDPAAVARAETILSRTAVFDAVMRNGISPTMLDGGVRANVIPAVASVLCNVRTVPGESIDAALERMRAAIDDAEVDVTLEERGEEAPASDPSAEMFDAIARMAVELNPDIVPVPYLSTGVTDSARLRRLGVQAYGILPFPMAQDDEERMHGHDERVPLESLHFGTQLIFGAIRRVAVAGS